MKVTHGAAADPGQAVPHGAFPSILLASRFCVAWEAIDTYEGTDTVQALIVGRDITGYNAFVPMSPNH